MNRCSLKEVTFLECLLLVKHKPDLVHTIIAKDSEKNGRILVVLLFDSYLYLLLLQEPDQTENGTLLAYMARSDPVIIY